MKPSEDDFKDENIEKVDDKKTGVYRNPEYADKSADNIEAKINEIVNRDAPQKTNNKYIVNDGTKDIELDRATALFKSNKKSESIDEQARKMASTAVQIKRAKSIKFDENKEYKEEYDKAVKNLTDAEDRSHLIAGNAFDSAARSVLGNVESGDDFYSKFDTWWEGNQASFDGADKQDLRKVVSQMHDILEKKVGKGYRIYTNENLFVHDIPNGYGGTMDGIAVGANGAFGVDFKTRGIGRDDVRTESYKKQAALYSIALSNSEGINLDGFIFLENKLKANPETGRIEQIEPSITPEYFNKDDLSSVKIGDRTISRNAYKPEGAPPESERLITPNEPDTISYTTNSARVLGGVSLGSDVEIINHNGVIIVKQNGETIGTMQSEKAVRSKKTEGTSWEKISKSIGTVKAVVDAVNHAIRRIGRLDEDYQKPTPSSLLGKIDFLFKMGKTEYSTGERVVDSGLQNTFDSISRIQANDESVGSERTGVAYARVPVDLRDESAGYVDVEVYRLPLSKIEEHDSEFGKSLRKTLIDGMFELMNGGRFNPNLYSNIMVDPKKKSMGGKSPIEIDMSGREPIVKTRGKILTHEEISDINKFRLAIDKSLDDLQMQISAGAINAGRITVGDRDMDYKAFLGKVCQVPLKYETAHIDQEKGGKHEPSGFMDSRYTVKVVDSGHKSEALNKDVSVNKGLNTFELGDAKGLDADGHNKEVFDRNVVSNEPLAKGMKDGDKTIKDSGSERFSDAVDRIVSSVKNIVSGVKKGETEVLILNNTSYHTVLYAYESGMFEGEPDGFENMKKKFIEKGQAPTADTGIFTKLNIDGKDVVILRHGETDDNNGSRFRRDEVGLTEKGERQILDNKELREIVGKDFHITSGDLSRNKKTAELLLQSADFGRYLENKFNPCV
ncbi:MAG: histidine phosphatase family protein [Nitrospirae bacterium]|nr:histidine phosphatase family protein [Nitrospirota bacterium]